MIHITRDEERSILSVPSEDQEILSRFVMLARHISLAKDLPEIVRFMPTSVLDVLDAVGCSLVRIEDDGQQTMLAHGGRVGELWEYVDQDRAAGGDPVLDALREARIVVRAHEASQGSSPAYVYVTSGMSIDGIRIALLVHARRSPDNAPLLEIFLNAIVHVLLVEIRALTASDSSSRSLSTSMSVSLDGGPMLSDRQRQVLDLMGQGATYGQMALRLGYSESTVKQEAMRIFRKLGVRNRQEAALHLATSSVA